MNDRIFATYSGLPGEGSLPGLCRELYAGQLASWRVLAAAHRDMQALRRREVHSSGGVPFWVQFNPGRVASAEARLDPASVTRRPCFLCGEHLPPSQKAILYRGDYLILCNPAPIFAPHFTMAHVRHRPQSLAGSLSAFLLMAEDLGPDLTVFYNGPCCGASAPDHLHFQGSPAGAIPVETDTPEKGGIVVWEGGTDLVLRRFSGRGGHFFLFAGSDREALAAKLAELLEAAKKIMGGDGEAMVNMICSYVRGRGRAFLFPRRKHRPAAFFRTGEERLVVSPGAVDMGGLVITTNERDYGRLDEGSLTDLFAEVSVEPATMEAIADALPTGRG